MTSSAHESTAADRSLPDVPRLVFLDTNTVQNLASFGEFIYENGPITDVDNKLRNKGQKIRDDVLALVELMDFGRRRTPRYLSAQGQERHGQNYRPSQTLVGAPFRRDSFQ